MVSSVLPITVGCIRVCFDSERPLSVGTCEALQAFLISTIFDLSQITKCCFAARSFLCDWKLSGRQKWPSLRGCASPRSVWPWCLQTWASSAPAAGHRPGYFWCKSPVTLLVEMQSVDLDATASHLSILHSFPWNAVIRPVVMEVNLAAVKQHGYSWMLLSNSLASAKAPDLSAVRLNRAIEICASCKGNCSVITGTSKYTFTTMYLAQVIKLFIIHQLLLSELRFTMVITCDDGWLRAGCSVQTLH